MQVIPLRAELSSPQTFVLVNILPLPILSQDSVPPYLRQEQPFLKSQQRVSDLVLSGLWHLSRASVMMFANFSRLLRYNQ